MQTAEHMGVSPFHSERGRFKCLIIMIITMVIIVAITTITTIITTIITTTIITTATTASTSITMPDMTTMARAPVITITTTVIPLLPGRLFPQRHTT